jgi:predicted transcriptional regulator
LTTHAEASSAQPDFLAHALKLAAYGLSIFPLLPREKKPNSAVLPLGDDNKPTWKPYQQNRASDDEIRMLWKRAPHSNIGIATGHISGVFVLDLDSQNAIVEAERRGLPRTPIALTSRGKQIYFAHPGGIVGNRTHILPDMDIRGDGGYVVGAGSIHPSGAVYRWEISPEEAPFAPPPQWLLDLLYAPPEPPAAAQAVGSNGRSSTWSATVLQTECDKVRDTIPGSRNDQLNRSAFMIGQLVGAGDVDRTTAENALLTAASASGLGVGEARATIKSGLDAGEREPYASSRPSASTGASGLSKPAALETPQAIGQYHYKFISIDELDKLPKVAWLLSHDGDHILPRGGICVLSGKPGLGKSFLALDIAQTVGQQEAVIYIASEGQGGYLYRDAAWRAHYQRRSGQIYFLSPDSAQELPLLKPEAVAAFIDSIQSYKPALIIIDTLIYALGDGQENESHDIHALIQACRAIIHATGATILLIHHCGKNGDEPRGSSALRGDLDAEMLLKEQDGLLALASTKARYAQKFTTRHFKLVDQDIAPGETCPAIVPVQPKMPPKDTALDERHYAILQCLHDAIANGESGLNQTQLANGANIPRSSLKRDLDELKARGLVQQANKHYSLTQAGESCMTKALSNSVQSPELNWTVDARTHDSLLPSVRP